jgi:serine/threonine-protein kinase HipA
MDQIIEEIITPVKNWRKMAKNIGIPNNEQKLMAKAFRV